MNSIPEGYSVEQFVGSTESVIAKQIWNAALELAAKMAEDKGLVGMARLAYEIRSKKK